MTTAKALETINALCCLGIGLVDARCAAELAERVGAEDGRASPAPTSAVVEHYLAALVRLVARGDPIPKDVAAMRAALKRESTRDAMAMFGIAFTRRR